MIRKETQNENFVGLAFEDIIDHSNGLICYLGGEFNPLLFYKLQNKRKELEYFLSKIFKTFQNNIYFELQRIDNILLDEFMKLVV